MQSLGFGMRVFLSSCLPYKILSLRRSVCWPLTGFFVECGALEPSGRIAGIDFGTVRIGVAVADARFPIASPYANYNRRTPRLDAEYFADLARRELITQFVVGLPVHLSGQESQKSRQAREFGQWLTAATGVPVVYFDERFTTAEAEQHLAAAQLTRNSGRPAWTNWPLRFCFPRIWKPPVRVNRRPATSHRRPAWTIDRVSLNHSLFRSLGVGIHQ